MANAATALEKTGASLDISDQSHLLISRRARFALNGTRKTGGKTQ
jgi:hypothetical protein